jgi:hypothetical protein
MKDGVRAFSVNWILDSAALRGLRSFYSGEKASVYRANVRADRGQMHPNELLSSRGRLCYGGGSLDLSTAMNESKTAGRNSAAGRPPVSRSWRHWRAAAFIVLLVGLGAAGLVYATGTPPEDLSADPSTARAYKTEARNVEINFGGVGLLAADFTEEMKYPGVQAGIILVVAAALSSGCLYVSRLLAQAPPADEGNEE